MKPTKEEFRKWKYRGDNWNGWNTKEIKIRKDYHRKY